MKTKINSILVLVKSCSFRMLLGAVMVVTSMSAPAAAQVAAASKVGINTPGWSDSPFLSRDGQRLYFMYSRYNFFPFFSGGAPVLQGPDRPGLHKMILNNPFLESDIYVSECQANGYFGEPVPLAFNQDGGDASGMEVNNSFYYLHTVDKSPDIYMATRTPTGWSAPVRLPDTINSADHEDNPHVAPNEDGIWFTSTRAGGYGGKDIYFSYKVNGEWAEAVNAGASINTSADEDQIWIDPVNMKDVYFNRDMTIYKTQWLGDRFAEPEALAINGVPMAAEISITDDMKTAAFAVPDVNEKLLKIMLMRKDDAGNWGDPVPADKFICKN